jgi:hypothetical protein
MAAKPTAAEPLMMMLQKTDGTKNKDQAIITINSPPNHCQSSSKAKVTTIVCSQF